MQKRKNSSGLNPYSNFDTKRVRHSAGLSNFDLLQLLDTSSLSDLNGISVRFDEIAEALLQSFTLIMTSYCGGDERETCFKILELEFYLWKAGCHEDPFTHGSEEQMFTGQWYFHRVPRKTNNATENLTHSTGYRGGSRKGLDLTFGGPFSSVTSRYFKAEEGGSSEEHTPKMRGGILLRSIQRAQDGKVISGPSLLVDELLSVTKASNITDLVQNQWSGDISCFSKRRVVEGQSSYSSLTLRPSAPSLSESLPTVHKSPRIGLDLSNPNIPLTPTTPLHPRIAFISKPYRYFTQPNLLVANGRQQTFLGGLYSLNPFPITHGHTIPDETINSISLITGIREQTVRTYIGHFVSGFDHATTEDEDDDSVDHVAETFGILAKAFLGTAGKGVSSNPARYLKMMGCLARIDERLKSTT